MNALTDQRETPLSTTHGYGWALIIAALAAGACAPMGGGMGGGRSGGMERGPGGGQEPRYINPGTLAALPGFTHAVKVGLVTYVSCEVALDSMGQLVGPGSLRAQARQAFANLALVLNLAKARPADVAKLTVYVVKLARDDIDVIREAAPSFFPQRNPPSGTIIGIAALPKAGLLLARDAGA